MNRRDLRTSFDEATAGFVAFLRTQGWPTEIRWLTRDRITGRRNRCWLFRPEELTSDQASRVFYEAARKTASSIRLDALGRIEGRTIAYVYDWGRDSRLLNFGVVTSPIVLNVVNSRIKWRLLRFVNAFRGESPLVNDLRIPPSARATSAA